MRGKLAGKRVTLIQTGDYADATQDAATALRDAGAVPVVTVVLRQPLGRHDRRQAHCRAGGALGAGAWPAEPRALPSRWKMQGLVTVTGDLAAPCALFVLVGGGRKTTTPTCRRWTAP